MSVLYPLRFEPILRRSIWGGRRLETHLRKRLGPESDYAESWEICDRGKDQSVVLSGPLAGKTLGNLVAVHGAELLGRHHPQDRFPLLMKFLDATETLSVQVHPDDDRAARLDPPELGKTEAWVVLAAEPGSEIYAGLRPGVDRQVLEEAIRRGECEPCLHRFQPRPGDCIFLPAGTVHALGKGLLVAEIQQSSDTTYRLFDWNRLGADGQPRPLHVEQGLEAVDYGQGPIGPQRPQATDHPAVERLVECEKFVLRRWHLDSRCQVGGQGRCHIISILTGAVEIEGDPAGRVALPGQTILLPAGGGTVEINPDGPTVLLEVYLP